MTSKHGTVHPRWRGEQLLRRQAETTLLGSSPLARGTADGVAQAVMTRRFIPAGAGNRFEDQIEYGAVTVHPRWRGEQALVTQIGTDIGGSSPLARGTALPGCWSFAA